MFNLLQKEEIFRDVPHAPVLAMARRWNDHFKAKRFRLAMPADTPLGASVGPEDFWTSPLSYGTLPLTEPALFAELQRASLVIFKGMLIQFLADAGDLVRTLICTINTELPQAHARRSLAS